MKALRIGLIDIVHAIEEGRPCRASGAMALHMLEVSEAITSEYYI